jgi:hypothetical protein
MTRELKPEAVAQLSALDVKRYLVAKGWDRVAGRKPDVGIFRRAASEEAEDAEVLLPLSLDFADVPEAMARAVAEIARFEQRPAAQVLRDLRRPRSDVLRFAVESRDTADGGIGLDEGLTLLSGSKKALLAAACSVKRPQRFHPRMTLREAETFVRSCRLGQTEHGSFVATVECELDVDDSPPLLPLLNDEALVPFGRKATTLLMQSVARVVDAIRADDTRALIEPPPGAPVVSANLCEAIVEMMPAQDDGGLRIGSSWSPLLAAPRDVAAFVRIEGTYRRAIEEVVRALRPGTSPTPDLYVGKVDALQGEPGPDGRMQGEVVLAAQVEDAVLKMRFELDPDDYVVAGNAHLEGRYVSVRGVLKRGARVHRLEQPGGFAIVGG